jgi:solute carrier family 25 (adenine nucleotide translocator) protein 4/5/6/31
VKFFWAQASVIFSEFLSYPGDTVKRKIMMQSLKKQKEYNGIVDCFSKTYKNEGLNGLWKGAYSNILRSVGSSLCLVLYDEFRKFNNH